MPLSQRLIHRARRTHGYRATRNYSASMGRPVQMTEAIRKKEKDYGQRAQTFVAKLDVKLRANLPTIKPGTQEWKAWERYFIDYLGFLPWAMKHVGLAHLAEKTDAAMTVPSQWPEWFDTEYAATKAA